MLRPSILRAREAAFGIALALAIVPAAALAQHLGSPTMRVETWQVVMPYDAAFDTSVVASHWPPRQMHAQKDQSVKDANGRIALHSDYTTNSLPDIASAWADDTGLLGAYSRKDDPYTMFEFDGALTHGLWAQSFRKDSPGATLTLQLTGAELEVHAEFGGCRSEFTFEAVATQGSIPFFTHREVGALAAFFTFPTSFEQAHSGQMVMTQSTPNGDPHGSKLEFAGASIPVDLSGVPVGAEFTLRCNLVTEAVLNFAEVSHAHATFGNELTETGGMQISSSGLTTTNNPVLPPEGLAVAAAPVARLALSQPRPNPSPAGATFELQLEHSGPVEVDVLDMAGRRVASIAGSRFEAGRHALAWDGRDGSGRPTAAGVFFIRARADGRMATQRFVKLAR
jgi:hypothetical protein